MNFFESLDKAKQLHKDGRKSIANQIIELAIENEYQKDITFIKETIFRVIDRLFERHKGDPVQVVKDDSMQAMIRVARKCDLVDECNAHYTQTKESWKDKKLS